MAVINQDESCFTRDGASVPVTVQKNGGKISGRNVNASKVDIFFHK